MCTGKTSQERFGKGASFDELGNDDYVHIDTDESAYRGYNPSKRYEAITIGDPTSKTRTCPANAMGMFCMKKMMNQKEMYDAFTARYGNKPHFTAQR